MVTSLALGGLFPGKDPRKTIPQTEIAQRSLPAFGYCSVPWSGAPSSPVRR